MNWAFKASLWWTFFMLCGIFLHEFIHLMQVGFDFEQVCFIGYDKDSDAVGWVLHDDTSIDSSRAELVANVVGFGVPSLFLVFWLLKENNKYIRERVVGNENQKI